MSRLNANTVETIYSMAVGELKKNGLLYMYFEIMKANSDETYKHSIRVAKEAIRLGGELGFNEADLLTLAKGGLVHDLGKLLVESNVLYKPTALNAIEMSAVKLHTTHSLYMLRTANAEYTMCDIALHHHERLNGKGYPERLKMGQISPLVQVISIVDVYDALIHNRCYRNAMSMEDAFEILKNDEGLNQTYVEFLMNMKMPKKGGVVA